MRLISCHNGQLLTVDTDTTAAPSSNSLLPTKIKHFSTTLPAIDALLPTAGFARGAVHELLWTPKTTNGTTTDFKPFFFAACLARAATKTRDGTGVPPVKKQKRLRGRDAHAISKHKPVVWSDPHNQLYPPALSALGIPLDRLFLLKPKTPEDELWAVTQCLACKGVGATIAAVGRLTRIQARRLQLAAERGGGVGLILRPYHPKLTGSKEHAAATRWLIEPAPGERTVQRWKIQLIHGHGGQTHRPVYLEYDRDRESGNDEINRVRAITDLADRPPQAPPAQVKRLRA